MASIKVDSITSRRNKLATVNSKKDSVKEYKAVSPLDESIEKNEIQVESEPLKEEIISEESVKTEEKTEKIEENILSEENNENNEEALELTEKVITEKIEEQMTEIVDDKEEISEPKPVHDVLVPLLTAENASSMIQKAIEDVIQKERKKQLDKEDPVINKGFYIRKSTWKEIKKYCLMHDITYSAFANDAFAEKLAREQMESN